jgi:hypothetical protein
MSGVTEEPTEGTSAVAVRRTTTPVPNEQWRRSCRKTRGYVEVEKHHG